MGSRISDYRGEPQGKVKTSNPSEYSDGKGKYFIMSPTVRRTYTDFDGAIMHAANYIQTGNSDEFLIVKVVGRVKKKPIPIEVVQFDD